MGWGEGAAYRRNWSAPAGRIKKGENYDIHRTICRRRGGLLGAIIQGIYKGYEMDKAKLYETNPDFLEFLNNEFEKTTVSATVEELAEFALGSLQEAIEVFEKRKNNED